MGAKRPGLKIKAKRLGGETWGGGGGETTRGETSWGETFYRTLLSTFRDDLGDGFLRFSRPADSLKWWLSFPGTK